MNVVVRIPRGDWYSEAIPVRALPYVSSVLSPTAITNGLSAIGLQLLDDDRPLLGGLSAYFLENSEPVEIPCHTWNRYVRIFDARDEGLPDFDPEYRDGIKMLPAGVFVWKSSFESIYGEKSPPAAPGEPENPMVRVACYEPLIPADMREIVMEGFELVDCLPQGAITSSPIDHHSSAADDESDPVPQEFGKGVSVTLSHMTDALEAIFKVMRDNWANPDPKRLPKQVAIAREIDEALRWGHKGAHDKDPSRTAKALAAIIKPNNAANE